MTIESDLGAAAREWQEAADAYRLLLERFVPVSSVEPGKPLKVGEPFTPESIAMIEAAREREKEAHDKMKKLMLPGRGS